MIFKNNDNALLVAYNMVIKFYSELHEKETAIKWLNRIKSVQSEETKIQPNG